MKRTADAVVCGGGIIGTSVAHQLRQLHGINALVVDPRPPLSLTSAYSTECYRDFWHDPVMHQFMSRSVGMMKQEAQEFKMFPRFNRGYIWMSNSPEGAVSFKQTAAEYAAVSSSSKCQIRLNDIGYINEDFSLDMDNALGIDILDQPGLVKRRFPFVGDSVMSTMHVRNAGWIDAQQMGMSWISRSRINTLRATVTAVRTSSSVVTGVICRDQDGHLVDISTPVFVNASGPFLQHTNSLITRDDFCSHLGIANELHCKVLLKDELNVIPDKKLVGQMICGDSISLDWSSEELSMLTDDPELERWTRSLPPGLHFRPSSSGNYLVILWQVVHEKIHGDSKYPDVEVDKFFDDLYPELVVRGLSQYIPAFANYVGKITRGSSSIDGGYYTHASDNRPIIGPVPGVKGAFVCGGFSGYGIMAAPGAGELVANYIGDQSALPSFRSSIAVDRTVEHVSDHTKAGGQL
eukprot:TRINITY_DN12784_c0_g1_i3.p1 TRINITY_DN12784_c0_g1~~TRINITY_DN12784_c0_g1_i3.p1  ORF type:complete len:464 (-),score=74.85 TRINITY_DN12784_c0_g1_i3:1233-2624(-)